jgi:hypothetical protein
VISTSLARRVGLFTSLASLAFLVGCSADFVQSASSGTASVRLSGLVHGGNQPVSGSRIYLYAAGNGGYGTASRSMLGSPGYVTTGPNGDFVLTSQYTCQAGDQVYLLSLGGNPGLAAGTDNASLAEMAALGACSNLSASTQITVSEVTTVAAAYALSGFMTSPTSLASSGTTLANIGVANAFLTAANLADFGTGQVRSTTLVGNGSVPFAEINSLANSIASCVNSNGTTAACSTLFAAATPTGGVAPTDTLQAILNIVHNPGLSVGTIYTLSTASAPFQPALSAAPHDWSLAVSFPTPGNTYDGVVAVDGLGNVWFRGGKTMLVYGPAGGLLSPTGFAVGSASDSSISYAIDPSNNAWIYVESFSGNPNTRVIRMNNAGSILSTYTGGGVSTHDSSGIAFDASGNMWSAGGSLSGGTTTVSAIKLSSTGAAISPTAGYPSSSPVNSANLGNSLYADTSGNVWADGQEFSATGSVIHTTSSCAAVSDSVTSIDRNGNLWTANNNTLNKCSSTGVFIASYSPLSTIEGTQADGDNRIWVVSEAGPSLGVTDPAGNILSPNGGYQTLSNNEFTDYMAIDGSGNIWVPSAGTNNVFEFVGIASPVITPVATAVAAGKLGSRP